MNLHLTPGAEGLRTRLFHIIFESDTPGAKAFDIALIGAILLSVAVIMLGSIEIYAERYADADGRIRASFLARASGAGRPWVGDCSLTACAAYFPHSSLDGFCRRGAPIVRCAQAQHASDTAIF